jgi:hydrogenase maturation protein HypF
MPRVRREVRLRGVVQGVGLRPWAARRARERGLAGSVRNTADGAWLALEGEAAAVEDFLRALSAEPPSGARVESLESAEVEPRGALGFAIEESEAGCADAPGRIPPDAALCRSCCGELFDPADRRYRYAFLHCAGCGPRASVLLSLPYDRERTALRDFPPCADCRREYEDPDDRRHHAQTIACPACGPRLRASRADGTPLAAGADPAEAAARCVAAGGIAAVKGYGGYHLAADATSPAAVARLRKRKGRPRKPFALLVPDLAAARALVELSPEDEALLAGPHAVVVAPRREAGCAALGIAAAVAPGARDLGILLPYAPLHWLLLYGPGSAPGRDVARFPALVFTSANASGEPTLWDDAAAAAALAGIADLVVAHDRAVARPSDDPVFRSAPGGAIALRLSRATAPRAIALPAPLRTPEPVLALGGDLKCAPAVAAGGEVLLGEHVGDLSSAAAADALAARAPALCALAGVSPAVFACDLHPDAIAAEIARSLGGRRVRVQHHHAHAAACLAENACPGPALALVLDGAGFGPDGSIWGGELLWIEEGLADAERLAWLEPVSQPGGDAAAREPWRMATVWLERAFPEGAPRLPWHARRAPALLRALSRAAAAGIHSPATSSCGRLFDAVASLLDCGDRVSFEGEAASALESLAAGAQPEPRPAPLRQAGALGPIPAADLVRAVALGRARGEEPAVLARRFHAALAERLAGAVRAGAQQRRASRVALSGGCFQNRLLRQAVQENLEAAGLEGLVHRSLPPNDGALAVGQAVVAVARLLSGTRLPAVKAGALLDERERGWKAPP